MPFEYDGCYIKYIFPKEIQVSSSVLRTYTGKSLLVSSSGGSSRTPEEEDFESEEKYVIIEGCLKNLDSNFIEYTLELEFSKVYLPYAVRSTSNFVVEVYKNYYSEKSLLIASSTESIIHQENFEPNTLSFVSFTATNYEV